MLKINIKKRFNLERGELIHKNNKRNIKKFKIIPKSPNIKIRQLSR